MQSPLCSPPEASELRATVGTLVMLPGCRQPIQATHPCGPLAPDDCCGIPYAHSMPDGVHPTLAVTAELEYRADPPLRASGGIGRRTGFRFQRGNSWRFDPSLAHINGIIGDSDLTCRPRATVCWPFSRSCCPPRARPGRFSWRPGSRWASRNSGIARFSGSTSDNSANP